MITESTRSVRQCQAYLLALSVLSYHHGELSRHNLGARRADWRLTATAGAVQKLVRMDFAVPFEAAPAWKRLPAAGILRAP